MIEFQEDRNTPSNQRYAIPHAEHWTSVMCVMQDMPERLAHPKWACLVAAAGCAPGRCRTCLLGHQPQRVQISPGAAGAAGSKSHGAIDLAEKDLHDSVMEDAKSSTLDPEEISAVVVAAVAAKAKQNG